MWTLTLPDLCSAIVRDGDPPDPTSGEIACLMVMHAWSWLDAAIGDSATMTQPSARRERMQELGPALLAVLRAAAVADDTALRQRIVDAVRDPVFRLGPLLLHAIDASKAIPTDELQRLGVVTLAQHCAESLAGELAMPQRAAGDWSITSFVSGDGCQDCIELASFLADATRQQLLWPIAKPRRQHIHRCIDDAELPVTHRTTREGSPHKLVLTKTKDLFTLEAEQRTNARATLAAIQPLLPIGRPTRVRSR